MSPAAGRVVSQKMNFWGQGNKGRLTSSAVRRRTDEYPPARLLLPGGLEPQRLRIGGGADSGLCFLHVADADEEHVVGAGNVRGRLRSGAFLPPSRIFLLGAAGEQEENGLGASASGPADLTQKMSPPAVESCPRR